MPGEPGTDARRHGSSRTPPDALAATKWDLLVIGGGLAGLLLAREAAARGWRTALVQRRRLGSGASGAWHGLLTGTASDDALRATPAERRTRAELLRTAPHLVVAERVLAPEWSGDDRWALRRRGLRLRWELLGAPDGNLRDVHGLNKHRLLAAEPALRLRGLAGALAVPVAAVDPGAFLLAVARAAADAGAVLASHAPALALLEDDTGRITGALVRDALTGATVTVAAAMTVLATGASPAPPRRRAASGRDLAMDDGAADVGAPHALAAPGTAPDREARLLALPADRVEVRGTLLLASALDGTRLVARRQGATLLAGPVHPAPADGSLAWVTATLRGLNAALPTARLSHGDVLGVRAAAVPADAAGPGGGPAAAPEVGRAAAGAPTPGLAVFSSGPPLALLRRVPAALERIATAAGVRLGPPAPLRLPGAEARDLTPLLGLGAEAGLSPAAAAHCLAAYGAEAAALFNRCQQDRSLRRALHPEHPAIAAEAEFAVLRGFAATVEDVLDGVLGLDLRTPDGGAAAAEATARLLAPLRGWAAEAVPAAAAAHVAATARAASRIAALGA